MARPKSFLNRRLHACRIWHWLMLLVLTAAMLPAPAVHAIPSSQAVEGQDLPPGFEANLPGNPDPVLTAEERLWQQIEAATDTGDDVALRAAIQQLGDYNLPAAIRLAREIAPPAARPAPAPTGPISREEELQQAAADDAQRGELLRQEDTSRAQAQRPTPADDDKWATPPGDASPQLPAAILTVGDSCTYATVQSAVNAAASGDTIRVQGKTFTGATVNINARSLTLSGGWNSTCTTQGSTRTTLDATGQGDTVVEVYGGAVPLATIIDNFILVNGEPDVDFGGALEIDDQNTVTLRRTYIRYNDSSSGGGIHMSAATVLNLEQETLVYDNNALQGDGGGIHCTGGAINISEDSIIGYFDNTASGNGGGLYLDNCTVYLNSTASESAQIVHNTATNGGGIYATNGSYINLRGSNAAIAENSASGNGGGVYLAGASDLYVDNGSISLNTAGVVGGGVYATDDLTTVDMDLNSVQACSGKCTQISNNTASSHGGAAYLTGGADLDFNGVYAEGNSGSLGSAFYARGDATVRLDNVMATDNTASNDYTLRLFNSGGAPAATTRNSTFAGNSGQSVSFAVDTGTSLDGDDLIVWANSDTSLVLGSGDVTIDCSIVQYDFPGSNNLVGDPEFWNPAGGDYHIARTSPAVDHCSSGQTIDVDGDSRPYDVAGVGALLEAAAQATPEQRAAAPHAVHVITDELGGRRLDEAVSGALMARDYGSFAWLALDDAQFAQLQASGIPFENEEGFGLISFDVWRFDPVTDGLPVAPAVSPRNDQGQGLSLVQLYAPAGEQDMDALSAAGAMLQHYPYNAFLLWSDARSLSRLAGAPNVRWIGDFASAFRLSARLAQAAVEAGPAGLPHVQALLLDDGNLAGVERIIQDAGGVILSRAPRHAPGEVMPLETWEFSLPAGLLDTLARQPQLIASDIVGKSEIDDERSNQIVAGNAPGGEPETGYTTWLNDIGYRGRNVTVAIVDTGVDWDHPDLNVVSGTEYGGYVEPNEPGSDGAPDVNLDTRGSGHGTHVAGIVAGDGGSATADPDGFVYGLGMAPSATLHAMDAIAEDNTNPSVIARVREAAANADLSNNSWFIGSPAGYTLDASNQDDWVLDADRTNVNIRDPFLTVFSAGNAGDDCGAGPCMSSITAPKEAKNIITVANGLSRRSDTGSGLTGDIDALAASSSRGPAFDGRLLPNLTAPGTNIISTENRVVTAGGVTNLTCAFSPGNSTQHSYCTGTSQSTPHVTGAAALFFEFWRLRFGAGDPYPETVKAAFVNATDNLAGGDNGWGTPLGHRPDNHQGWGRLNVDRVLNPSVAVQYYQTPVVMTSAGDVWEKTFRPNDSGEPLRISLVWSDAPGTPNANPARVNNLDLRVTSAGGTIWRGNVFSGGWSATGGAYDSLNNVENVFVQTPSSGSYTVRVTATALNGDAYYYNGDITDQHFSLVCWNCEEILDGTYDAGADEAYAFVGIDGTACAYPTIGSAISAAASGATIYISPGTYLERLGLIDKDLVLTAATNDCGAGASSGVTIDANDAAATNGGVAQIGTGRSVTFANLTLTDGTASLGGIVYVGSGAYLVLDNTDLSFGSASSLGGGLRIYNGTVEMINTSRILGSETTVSNGGGAALDGGTLILRGDSRIGDYLQSNIAAGLGGGVYLDGGVLYMEDTSRVRSNTAATNGGGVYALNSGDIVMDDSAAIGWSVSTAANSAVDGGGVYLAGAGTTLTLNDDSSVRYNTASADGGGIYVTGGAGVTVNSARVDDNQAVARGGAIMVDTSATVDVQNGATVNGNQATGASGLGGGLYMLGDSAAVTVNASQVNSNVAGHSYGGIRVYGASSLDLSNGATLNSNQAQIGPGGGLSLYQGTVTISDAVIQSNTAVLGGGGIYMDSGAVTITNPDIRYNQAASGPGGGIHRSGGTLSLAATTQTGYVADNTSVTNGGGIYDASDAPLVLRALGAYRLNINSNQAGINGGGIYALHAYVDAFGWIQMTGNTAASHGGALYLGSGATAWFDDYNTANVPEIWVNTATSGNGGGIYAQDSTRVELDGGQVGFAIGGNRALAGDGGGIYLDNSDLLVDNTIIVGNQAGDDGGGIAAVNASSVTMAPTLGLLRGPGEGAGDEVRSPQATACDPDTLAANAYCIELRGNSANDLGGGIFFQGESSGSIVRTAFVANTAATGSALELYDATVSLHNSLVRDNVADGANKSTIHVYNEGGAGPTSTFHAQHNTITHNSQYGIFYANTTGGTFDNNIVWGNSTLGFVTGGGLSTTATCNDTQDSVLAGPGNISLDPRFITTARGAYHLKPGSPALDACAAGSGPDLDAITRPRGVQFDMGSFELWCASGVTDVNGSGKTDIVDVGRVAGDFLDASYLPQHDINCDGVVDLGDITLVAAAWAP